LSFLLKISAWGNYSDLRLRFGFNFVSSLLLRFAFNTLLSEISYSKSLEKAFLVLSIFIKFGFDLCLNLKLLLF